MDTTATSALNSTRPDASRTNSTRHLGLALLAATLISAMSCSSDTTTNAATTTTSRTSTTTTTTIGTRARPYARAWR